MALCHLLVASCLFLYHHQTNSLYLRDANSSLIEYFLEPLYYKIDNGLWRMEWRRDYYFLMRYYLDSTNAACASLLSSA